MLSKWSDWLMVERLVCCAWATWGIQLNAADWPAFRGPRGDGIAEKESLPTWFNSTSNLLWKEEVPIGLSSPLVWKDNILVTGEEGKTLKTLCLDARSGKSRWE